MSSANNLGSNKAGLGGQARARDRQSVTLCNFSSYSEQTHKQSPRHRPLALAEQLLSPKPPNLSGS